jgi:hypothetical protein
MEGTVVHSAPDAQEPSRRVWVPVTAGTAEKIKKGETPVPAAPAPEPQRKVTVEVGAGSSLVVDTLGRSNGFTRDGKRVIQTPGTTVKKDGDRVIVVLPDLPDGKLVARVDEPQRSERSDNGNSADIKVQTTVEEHGKAPVRSEDSVKAAAPKLEVRKTGDAPKAADKAQSPTAPRLVPTLPATTPKRVDPVVPKPSENKSTGAQTDRTGSSQSNGNDPKSSDKGK